MLFQFAEEQRKLGTNKIGPGDASEDKAMQDRVQRILAEDAKKNPLPVDKKEATNFKGPEGFSNVVGVGANPVMEAMSSQLEESQKQTSLLQSLVDRNPFMPTDFTKTETK
jgi:hypothetical protein